MLTHLSLDPLLSDGDLTGAVASASDCLVSSHLMDVRSRIREQGGEQEKRRAPATATAAKFARLKEEVQREHNVYCWLSVSEWLELHDKTAPIGKTWLRKLSLGQ